MLRAIVPVAALVSAAVSGCTIQTTAPAPPAPAAPAAAAPSFVDRSAQHRFGETYTEGMVHTRVGEPEPFSTSQFAYPANGPAWRVDVTLDNTSEVPQQVAALQVRGSVDGRMAQQVFDPAKGLHSLVQVGVLAPHQRITVPMAFSGAGQRHEVTVTNGAAAAVFAE